MTASVHRGHDISGHFWVKKYDTVIVVLCHEKSSLLGIITKISGSGRHDIGCSVKVPMFKPKII